VAPAVAALGDDAGELFDILEPWCQTIRAGGGYPAGAGDLVRGQR
jgi:hypothetical protein